MLLQVKRQKDTSKKRRCEVRMYREALTSDEVFERIEEHEAQKKEKRREKKGRAASRQRGTADEVVEISEGTHTNVTLAVTS